MLPVGNVLKYIINTLINKCMNQNVLTVANRNKFLNNPVKSNTYVDSDLIKSNIFSSSIADQPYVFNTLYHSILNTLGFSSCRCVS